MSRDFTHAYGAWSEDARRPFGWSTPLLLIAGFGVAQIVAAIVAIVAIMVSGVELGDAEMIESIPFNPGPFASLVLVQFAVWLGVTVLWMGVAERRGLASAGLGAPGLFSWIGRYLFGLLTGFNLVVLLGLAGWALSVVAPGAVPDYVRPDVSGADLGVFQDRELWMWLGVFAVVFLFQGGVEEIIFRGWMLSALAARWGRVMGVLVSSLAFALVHFHIPLASGWAYAGPVLAGIFMIGLFFALWSVDRRSIVGPMAAHGAFNFFVTASALVIARIENPDTALTTVFADAIREITGQAGAAFSWALLVPAGVFGLLCFAMLVRLALSGRKAAAE